MELKDVDYSPSPLIGVKRAVRGITFQEKWFPHQWICARENDCLPLISRSTLELHVYVIARSLVGVGKSRALAAKFAQYATMVFSFFVSN